MFINICIKAITNDVLDKFCSNDMYKFAQTIYNFGSFTQMKVTQYVEIGLENKSYEYQHNHSMDDILYIILSSERFRVVVVAV